MGTAGHMQHPFNVPRVKSGQDLINYFERIVGHLSEKNPETGESTNIGSVKFDGINVSFKLVNDETTHTGKDFRMDRGTSYTKSVLGMTTKDAYEFWPDELQDDGTYKKHGMPPAIEELLKIFNEALPQIKPELEILGMWDDPTKYFNTEYMKKGKTNVIEYAEKILAIHSVNQFYEKKARKSWAESGKSMDRPGAPRPIDPDTEELTKDNSFEINYDKGAVARIIEKVKPIAEKYNISLVGDVPTELITDIDFTETLTSPFSIRITEDETQTRTLEDWLLDAINPWDAKVTKKVVQLIPETGEEEITSREIPAIGKEVYVAIEVDKMPLDQYLLHPEKDVITAINGAIFNHATLALGMDVKRALSSSKGGLEGHEGVVLRGLEDRPLKVTGDFILKGRSGEIKKKISGDKKTIKEEINLEDDNDTEKTRIAVYPGRFQPMGQHHAEVFKELELDESFDKVYIATTDTVDFTEIEGVPKSPFNFEEKKQIMMMHEIPEEKIIEVINPYSAIEILRDYDPETTSITYFVGAKDMRENPRFQKTEGVTEDGYAWKIKVKDHVSIDIPDIGEMSGTNIKKALKDSEPETFETIMGWYDPILYDLIKNRLKHLEESQQPLGIFLRLIEEATNKKENLLLEQQTSRQLIEPSQVEQWYRNKGLLDDTRAKSIVAYNNYYKEYLSEHAGKIDLESLIRVSNDSAIKVRDAIVASYQSPKNISIDELFLIQQKRAHLRTNKKRFLNLRINMVKKRQNNQTLSPQQLLEIEQQYNNYYLRIIMRALSKPIHVIIGYDLSLSANVALSIYSYDRRGEYHPDSKIVYLTPMRIIKTGLLDQRQSTLPSAIRHELDHAVEYALRNLPGKERAIDVVSIQSSLLELCLLPKEEILKKGKEYAEWYDQLTSLDEVRARIREIQGLTAVITLDQAQSLCQKKQADNFINIWDFLDCNCRYLADVINQVAVLEPPQKSISMVSENILNIIEETINEATIVSTFGYAAPGVLGNIISAGSGKRDKKSVKDVAEAMIDAIISAMDEKELDENSTAGGGGAGQTGNVEGHAGVITFEVPVETTLHTTAPGKRDKKKKKKKKKKKEKQTLIREVEDYLFSILGVDP